MKHVKRTGLVVLTCAVLLGLMAVPVFAATRKKINSLALNITSEIMPDTKYGDEEIAVEVRTGRCTVDYYEIMNNGFSWVDDDVPEITIYLNADDGYYFALTKASSVKLNGATYVKASKQDSSETLALTVKLPSLAESVGDQEEVTLVASGYAVWEEVRGAGSYEVRLYRNGVGMGATILTTNNTYYDFSSMMNRVGSYYVRVRPLNKLVPENKGEWTQSQVLTLDQAMVDAIKNGEAGGMPLWGTWEHDGIGWWYRHANGSYTRNNWQEIKGNWYFFDENGYMNTGWIEWDGKMYYCNENTGAMMKSTTTPDGYILDADGTRKTGR